MKTLIKSLTITAFTSLTLLAQGFNVNATGKQTFSFEDQYGRNQATFFSTTPIEDINGLTNDVKGTASFDVSDISTLTGSVTISTASLKTGIELRDEHLRGENWLDSESHPEITFVIKGVGDIKVVGDNKVIANVTGDFSVHGVTKVISSNVTITYLDESEVTKKRAPGDLLVVQTMFNITLSDYEIDNMVLGQKVSDNIEIGVNLVGSNAK